MPLRFDANCVVFEGHCAVEEALDLTEFFPGAPAATVDVSGCASLHTALFQAVMASDVRVCAPPEDALLANATMPTLTAGM